MCTRMQYDIVDPCLEFARNYWTFVHAGNSPTNISRLSRDVIREQFPEAELHVWNSLRTDRSEVPRYPHTFPSASRRRRSSESLGCRVRDSKKCFDGLKTRA